MSNAEPLDFRVWAATARPRLRRTAYLLCGDWHQAEDLTQDVLVRVYAVWHRVSTMQAPDAYARKAMVNTHRSALRRPWRREHVVEAVPDQVDLREQLAGYEERDALLAALAGLGPSQRAIVVLRYWEDLSVVEVADLLHLSTGTVKSQAARGLQHLRRTLTALPVSEEEPA